MVSWDPLCADCFTFFILVGEIEGIKLVAGEESDLQLSAKKTWAIRIVLLLRELGGAIALDRQNSGQEVRAGAFWRPFSFCLIFFLTLSN